MDFEVVVEGDTHMQFKYEWSIQLKDYWPSGNRKRDIRIVNRKVVWSVGLKYMRSIVGAGDVWCFYFVSKCVSDPELDVVEVNSTDLRTGLFKSVPLVGNHGSVKIYAREDVRTCTNQGIIPPGKINIQWITRKGGRETQHQRLMSDHLWLSVTNDLFTDVEFHVGDEVIPAHKMVLASHSPVFRAMFQHDTEEARTNRVKITDTTATVFIDFLYFLYTGELKGSHSERVHALADKYQVTSLATLCKHPDRHLVQDDAADMISLLLSCPGSLVKRHNS